MHQKITVYIDTFLCRPILTDLDYLSLVYNLNWLYFSHELIFKQNCMTMAEPKALCPWLLKTALPFGLTTYFYYTYRVFFVLTDLFLNISGANASFAAKFGTDRLESLPFCQNALRLQTDASVINGENSNIRLIFSDYFWWKIQNWSNKFGEVFEVPMFEVLKYCSEFFAVF